jgi:hypothetical protein
MAEPTISNFIMVSSTVVIAIFSGLTWRVSHCIHKSTEKRDKEVKEILENLAAATLVNPVAVENEKVIVASFKKLREILRNLGPE